MASELEVGKVSVGTSASTETLAGFSDSQAAIVGGDNVGLALQSTNSNKSARVRFFDHSGNQDATVGFDNSTSNLFMGTGTSTHLAIDSDGNITQFGGSPEYHFGTTSASHYNWRIACQEEFDSAFEIASGTTSAGSTAASDTYTTRFNIHGQTGLATFNNDVAYGDNARVYHGNLPNSGPSTGHDKFNFNFTFSGTYGMAIITLDIAAGIGEVCAGRYTLAVNCAANSGVTTGLPNSVVEVYKHNMSALTFADSGSSNRTFTLSVERTVTTENWTPTGSYKLDVTTNHRTLTLNSVTAST